MTARSAPWAGLPLPLWDCIAGLLPLPNLMALRQGWRGAVRLGDARVRAAAAAALKEGFGSHVLLTRGCAMATAMDGVQQMLGAPDGVVSLPWLGGWLAGAMQGAWLGNSATALGETNR